MVRQLDKYEVDKLVPHGYRFAAITQIANVASKRMQIQHEDISRYLDRMRDSSVTKNNSEPGTRIAAFLLRPKVNKGFDGLVLNKTKPQLPTVAVPFRALSTSQLEILENFSDWRIADDPQELLLKTAGHRLSKTPPAIQLGHQ